MTWMITHHPIDNDLDDHTTSNRYKYIGTRTRHNDNFTWKTHSIHADQTTKDHPASVSSPDSLLPRRPPSRNYTSI
jgi:hypothetical protein